jgi:hypothetical protein
MAGAAGAGLNSGGGRSAPARRSDRLVERIADPLIPFRSPMRNRECGTMTVAGSELAEME